MEENVYTAYRLFRRRGVYYALHNSTRKRASLHTRDKEEAHLLLNAKNESERQPQLNLKLARVYLSASDPQAVTRTWRDALDVLIASKRGTNQTRWKGFFKHMPIQPLWNVVIIETQALHFWDVLNRGTVSTNKFLRILHNFALDMGWLQAPVIPKKQWPKVQYGEKRGITLEEHLKIIEREKNPERKAFYELAWHTGAAQSDLANLHAEDIDWTDQTISFYRMKTSQPVILTFGEETKRILLSLPQSGLLFSYLSTVRAGDRATEFKQRCRGLGIDGISLHSYRYAWAERAKSCGYPERFAMSALGHNSRAVHRAYAKKAQVIIPPLESYEKEFHEKKFIPFQVHALIKQKT